MRSAISVIAAKDMRDASRDRVLAIVAGFLVLAALTSLVTGAVALATDVGTYEAAKAALLALGKTADSMRPPEFYPLRLLRGTIEQTEIVGSALAILLGHRAALSERGRPTLALILTRPLARWQFLLGKVLAGTGLLALGLAAVLVLCTVALPILSGVALTADDVLRLIIVWAASVVYALSFFLMSFLLSVRLASPPSALLLSFAIWLLLVLIAPQIGDTMDPDNQVAGGVFRALGIARPDQAVIMQAYAGFEAIRNGIEVASVTKHFERFSFAVLGIKATYTGLPLGPILIEKTTDVIVILLVALGFLTAVLALPPDPATLAKD